MSLRQKVSKVCEVALKVVVQNDGYSVEVIRLYLRLDHDRRQPSQILSNLASTNPPNVRRNVALAADTVVNTS